MIINTGARTDIPAFFSTWFLNRIKEGFVYVRNPYYPKQVAKYSLTPNVVDCLIFCTKNPQPILPRIHKLDAFTSYWFVTITPYGKDVEPNVPPVDQVISDFRLLSQELGSHRVCWRYDPIFINEHYSVERHIEDFRKMANELSGYTDECVISFIDLYKKTKRNFPGIREVDAEKKIQLAKEFSQIGKQYNISLKTCAEAADLRQYGIQSSGCITQTIMEKAIGMKLKNTHSKPNRANCGCCIPNRDIGAYNTCPHGCKYCYANYDQETVKHNMRMHDPKSPLLIGQLSDSDIVHAAVQESYVDGQLPLF
ncbi:hypothetical protein SPSIL_006800 [Sporomusa silvacetica DSM 10669]|uniref:DUF1848 domain-containing protein n=1 Tax=Sporomusa silvacetica DSM 10669 TaxID=1123289 RepID=A0ABZ3IGS9_9FIRM|nr:DUF1848 domain-containing protein [Sporomusa silvacetica]OZC16432.1 hypothetical protein SPSIL_37150 [Sporomusa silvacetica DSM 10669]